MPDQLAIPVRLLANGRLATVEQGSDREISQRVSVLCLTPPGWLDDQPAHGLVEQTFNPGGVDLAEVERQILSLGPDVLARIIEDPSLMDDGLDVLGLETGAS